MRRRYLATALGLVALAAFAFFVPIVRIPPPSNCVFCPVEPQYGSLTYALLGHGGHYAGILMSGYYSISW